MDIRRVIHCVTTLAVLAWCGGASAEDFSDAKQYGNKTANLAKLNQSCSRPITIGAVEYTVKVPDFIGVSDKHVHDFLQEKISDFDARWDALCAPYREQQAEILANKKLPDDFLNAAEALGEDIKRACADAFEFTTGQVDFITTANANEYRLMVRSTGKEDTDKMANAGGNTTVINVAPTVQAIRSAIGEVVASYIGKKSLSQRVSVATDEENINDLFERPFMPVLLQVMIGEPRGGQQLTAFEDVATLPVPGVMFTTEAEGGTDGLVHIQTTFGHNEGVVNSLVPVDTWYVSKHDTVFPIVRHKHERLVPGAQGLERKKNTLFNGEPFGFLPSLNGETAQAIAQAGRVIEKHYKMPMDVEFVLIPQARTIYLVQARPIVAGEKNPMYLDDVFVSGKKAMQCSKVGVGRAEVAIAASADGIMVYETLAQALNVYLQKKSDDRNAIKCVVVQQAPAATSHEATTFRSFNMPVMQHNNVGSVIGWLASQKGQIVVDPQRGLLLATDKEVVLVNGWFESPLPRQLSVGVLGGMNFPEAVRRLLFNHVIQGNIPGKMLDIFEILKSPASKAQAEDALCVLLKQLFAGLKQLAGGRLHVRDLDKHGLNTSLLADVGTLLEAKSEMAYALMSSLAVAAQDYVRNIEQLADDALARNRQLLYPVQFMQTLYNQSFDQQIVAPISLATLLTGVKRDVRAVALSGASVQSVATLDMLKVASDYGFSPEIKHRWAGFTNGLSSLQQGMVMRQMQVLEELGSMPMFINVIFPSMYKQDDDAVGVVRQIVGLMERHADSFKTLQEMQQKIAGWDVGVFADPVAFTKQWDRFNNELLSYFMSDDFANMFQPLEKNNIVQMTALSVMHKMVDVFDTSIKSLKGSTEYAQVQQKVGNVHTMVVAYWNLFERWVRFLPENLFPVSTMAIYWLRKDGMQDIEKYCSFMRHFITYEFGGAQSLEPSSGFNVTLAAIGSSGRIDEVQSGSYKQRWTLEDYFTLSHQNLLVTLSYLLKQTIDLSSLLLPQDVKDFMMIFETPFEYRPRVGEVMPLITGGVEDPKPTYEASLVGILINADTVEFTYNIPLRGHSSSFGLSYDYKRNNVTLTGNFYRNLERPTVFQHIATYAKTLDIYTKTHLLSTRITQNATYLVWDVTRAHYVRVKDALTRILLLMYPETANIQLPEDHWDAIYSLSNSLEDAAHRAVVLAGLEYYSPNYQQPVMGRGLDVELVTPSGFDDVRNNVFDFFGNKFLDEKIPLRDTMQEILEVKDDSFAVLFFSSLLSRHHVNTRRIIEAAWYVADHNILRGFGVFEILIKHDIGFDDAMSLVLKVMQGNYVHAYDSAYNVLSFLVLEKNQEIETILNIVQNDNYKFRYRYIPLFKLFFKKNIGFKEAIVKAQGISKKENNIRFDIYYFVNFWVLLFENNQGFPEAIEVALDALIDVNDYERYFLGLHLFEALVNHGHGINEVVAFIEQRFFQDIQKATQKKDDIYKHFLILLQALVKQGKMFDLAIEITRELLQPNRSSFEEGLRLLKALVSQGQAFELAAQTIKNAIKIDSFNIKIITYELYSLLIKKGFFSNDFSNNVVEVINSIVKNKECLNGEMDLLKDALFYERYTDYKKVLDSVTPVFLVILNEFFLDKISNDPDFLTREDNLKVAQDLVVKMVINRSVFRESANEQVRTLLGLLLEKGKGARVIRLLKNEKISEDLGIFITSITKRVQQEKESLMSRWFGF